MRTTVSRFLFLALAAALTACGGGSIAPLFPQSAEQDDPRLLGTWRGPESRETAVISASGPRKFLISYTDQDGKTGQFLARLGRIGGSRVLEITPGETPPSWSDSYKSLLVPLYYPLVIDSVGTTLTFRILEPDSLAAYLKRQPNAIAHTTRDDSVILTGTTAAVERFLAMMFARRGALGESVSWRRQQ